MDLKACLRDRILVLDGAMGTMIQQQALTEDNFRGERFKGHSCSLKGFNDILSLTNPQIIYNIHAAYLKAGADIIETNTFNATSVSLIDYNLASYCKEINKTAAQIARNAADVFSKETPQKPRFVAGSIGPTNKTTSISPDVNDPSFRNIDFDFLMNSYAEQISGLIEGGVDLLLMETVFDTLNVKAALNAAEQVMTQLEKRIPMIVSLTLSDKGGRTLSGQTIDAFLTSIEHMDLLAVGLNCSFGAKEMKPFLKYLSDHTSLYVSAYPNAGLPNQLGLYDETPDKMANDLKQFVDEKIVNIVGGCCGTTPEHIRAISKIVKNRESRKLPTQKPITQYSGLENLRIIPQNNFINIGERCNVAGSRKFLRLIKEKKYNEALLIARKQVEDGAQMIDINMDDGMLDAKGEMIHFLNLIASEPSICRVPLMIDSSNFDVIESGLKCIQGKSVVNSISLKSGETEFLKQASMIKNLGAGVVVMAFDEKGQADTFQRRIEICQRAYSLLVDKINFNPYDIIFDPNVLAIATGIKAHNIYAVDFINATRWIKDNLIGAKISGGISNLSFSFRGNNYVREAIHAVFLYYAIEAGLDMGIVNPSTTVSYSDISSELLMLIENLIFNREEDATEKLINYIETNNIGKDTIIKEDLTTLLRSEESVEQRIIQSLIKGDSTYLKSDLLEFVTQKGKAIEVIDGPLMQGMNRVGELFGSGKMFLPQVVKTARTMKQAVEFLQPFIEEQKDIESSTKKKAKFLLATVKGDVHDIGKNIVSVILSCNNFEVIDLGVMVSCETIIKAIKEYKVDFVGLSGLITPSLEEMCSIASEMEREHMTIPLFIGGATTSNLHTAVKIAPNYSGPVFYVKDAAQNPILASKYLNPITRENILDELKVEQDSLRQSVKKVNLLSHQESLIKKFKIDWNNYVVTRPNIHGILSISDIDISKVRSYINWRYFFTTWKISGDYSILTKMGGCDSCKAVWLASIDEKDRAKALEAMQLYKEANRILDDLTLRLQIQLNARIRFVEVNAVEDAVEIKTDEDPMIIPFLRQQEKKEGTEDIFYRSLSDFILPKTSHRIDYFGMFVISIGQEYNNYLEKLKKDGDPYKILLVQSLGDRLVEAASEWLHKQVRVKYWGYAPDENITENECLRKMYNGIRPAIGYPSIPDQSINFILDKFLDFSQIGVQLTENGAMLPNASVSGFYFAHPKTSYFMVGKIDEEQWNIYRKLRRMSQEEMIRFLPVSLINNS